MDGFLAGIVDAGTATRAPRVDGNLAAIYAGLPETPTAAQTTHRFFGPPPGSIDGLSAQDRLLYRMGRDPYAPGW